MHTATRTPCNISPPEPKGADESIPTEGGLEWRSRFSLGEVNENRPGFRNVALLDRPLLLAIVIQRPLSTVIKGSQYPGQVSLSSIHQSSITPSHHIKLSSQFSFKSDFFNHQAKMQFTLTKVLAFALAVATGVSAGAVADSQAIKQQTEGKCDIGNVSCCNPTNVDKTDGFLNNLLEWGVVGSLVNGQGSACAPVSLIDELGILGMTDPLHPNPTLALEDASLTFMNACNSPRQGYPRWTCLRERHCLLPRSGCSGTFVLIFLSF